MRFEDEAFVVEVRDLAERDRIVGFLSRHHGRRRGVARAAKTKHSRFAGQLQLLAKVHVTWWEPPGRELGRLDGIELVRPARRFDSGELEDALLAFAIAEHVAAFAPEGETDDALFRLVDSVLLALDQGADREMSIAYLETWILRLAGIFPPLRECPSCGGPVEVGAALSVDQDAVVCRDCAGPQALLRLDQPTIDLLQAIGRRPVAELAGTPAAAGTVRRVREVLGCVRRGFLQEELRSYQVIASTLGRLDRA